MNKTANVLIENVDLDLAYQQKLALIDLLELVSGDEEGFGSDMAEALEGVIGLLDAVGDVAERDGTWQYPDIKD